MVKKDFEKFYQNNFDKVYRFVFFRTNYNKMLAEDLVSEIFIKALEHFENFDKDRGQSAWIFTIAKNHLANYWRDQKPTESLPEEDGEIVDKIWLKKALDNKNLDNSKWQIYELLAKLEPEEREIVTFHYLFGYSYLEISKIVGKTEVAVKVTSHRALKKMKKYV